MVKDITAALEDWPAGIALADASDTPAHHYDG
jgi:hypothetical protein